MSSLVKNSKIFLQYFTHHSLSSLLLSLQMNIFRFRFHIDNFFQVHITLPLLHAFFSMSLRTFYVLRIFPRISSTIELETVPPNCISKPFTIYPGNMITQKYINHNFINKVLNGFLMQFDLVDLGLPHMKFRNTGHPDKTSKKKKKKHFFVC